MIARLGRQCNAHTCCTGHGRSHATPACTHRSLGGARTAATAKHSRARSGGTFAWLRKLTAFWIWSSRRAAGSSSPPAAAAAGTPPGGSVPAVDEPVAAAGVTPSAAPSPSPRRGSMWSTRRHHPAPCWVTVRARFHTAHVGLAGLVVTLACASWSLRRHSRWPLITPPLSKHDRCAISQASAPVRWRPAPCASRDDTAQEHTLCGKSMPAVLHTVHGAGVRRAPSSHGQNTRTHHTRGELHCTALHCTERNRHSHQNMRQRPRIPSPNTRPATKHTSTPVVQ
jgi:hypothetical protein